MENRELLDRIVKLLNDLMAADPEMPRMLDAGLKANDAVQAIEGLYCRSTIDGDWVTTCGVLSAIGRIIGAEDSLEIASNWDIEDGKHDLTGFFVGTINRCVSQPSQLPCDAP